MVKFTASLLAEIVSSAVLKVKERKEFDASLRNEITSLIFELEEGSQEFSLLKTIYESLQKKGDAEKFYSSFYGKVALNATKYFNFASNESGRQYVGTLQATDALFYKQ